METILFLAHTEKDGTLAKGALEVLQTVRELAAQISGGAFLVGLVGEEVQAAANSLAGCGARGFFGVAGAEFACARYASDTAAAEALARAAEATLILAAGTSRFNRALPGLAHRLNGRVDTHVTGATAGPTLAINRWFYRQRMEAVLQRIQRPWILLLESSGGTVWQGAPGVASVQPVAVRLPRAGLRTQVTGLQAPPGHQQTIRPDANLLFVTGAGWTKKQPDGQVKAKEAEALILGFLKWSRASLGSTKSLVDLSGEGQTVLPFLTHLNQVGQTGSTPRHPKGLATCCHGEEPHTVGWRFIKERRAISLDPNCGWARGKADVLYVADAFEVMRELAKLA